MIQSELLNNNTLIKHWSDKFLWMLQQETGSEYPEAIDIIPCPYTYSEIENKYIYEEYDKERIYNKEERIILSSLVYESLEDENTDYPVGSSKWKQI